MDYLHHCVFCGWSRVARSEVVLDPRCDDCGCGLSAASRAELEARAGAPIADQPPALLVRALRAVALVTLLFVLYLAARTGYGAGGGWLAIAGFAVAALAFTPLIKQP